MILRALLLLCLGLALAGCGGREEAPLASPPGTVFEPAAYDYLTPLRLNVASVTVEQTFEPGNSDLGAASPMPPVAALRQMAQDRLGAFGADGRAVFVIRDASLRADGDEYVGNLAVSLGLYRGDTRLGFAEASVSRRRTISTITPRDAALYAMTKDLMDQMNVEFEFQVRHSLRDFLVAPASAEPAVEQENLGPPPSSGPPPGPPLPVPGGGTAAPATGLPPNVKSLGTVPAI